MRPMFFFYRIRSKFRRFGKKRYIFVLFAIIIIFVVWQVLSPKDKTQLQFTQVKKQDIKSTVAASGTLAGKSASNLKFKSSGKLAYINVKAGNQVAFGQAIAGLDTGDLATVLQQAQNTYRDKQALAQKAEDDVKDHNSDETFAQKATRTTAQVARDNAYDSVKSAQSAVDEAVLVSPISGIVTQAIAVSGQTVSSSDVIAQVVDISEIYFDTDVDEADVAKIKPGLAAEITLDPYPNKIFAGIVEQIIPQTKTTSSGATVISIRIKLQEATLTFVNGLTGQAAIIIAEVKNALTIPQEALREDNTAIVQGSEGLRAQKVEPGIFSDTDVEIKQGLTEGERVLLNPPAPGARLNQNRGAFGGIFRFLGGGTGQAGRAR